MKKEKGITLIALVITIIVLILLAGISIHLTLGENGIIGKAQLAKEKMINAQEEENIIVQEYEKHIVGTRENGLSYTILFDSVANTARTEYTLKDSIQNYDFVEVYARTYEPYDTTKKCFSDEQRIMVSDIDYENDTDFAYRLGFYYDGGSNFKMAFKFKDSNTLYLYEITQAYCTNAEIYKIIGYQY